MLGDPTWSHSGSHAGSRGPLGRVPSWCPGCPLFQQRYPGSVGFRAPRGRALVSRSSHDAAWLPADQSTGLPGASCQAIVTCVLTVAEGWALAPVCAGGGGLAGPGLSSLRRRPFPPGPLPSSGAQMSPAPSSQSPGAGAGEGTPIRRLGHRNPTRAGESALRKSSCWVLLLRSVCRPVDARYTHTCTQHT